MTLDYPNYLSDHGPDFTPFELDCGKIQAYGYDGDLKSEMAAGRLIVLNGQGNLPDIA